MREKWQAKLAMWRDRQDEKSNFLNGKAKYIYYVMGCITLFCFAFLIVKIVTYEEGVAEDSGTGEKSELSLGDASIQMISRKYNPNNHYMEILVQVQSEVSMDQQVDMIVTDGKKKRKLQKNWMQVTDQYYVLGVPNVPADWAVLFIDVGVIILPENQKVQVDLDNLLGGESGEKQENGATVYQDLWTVTRDKTEVQRDLEPQSEPYYVIKYSELEIQESNKKLKEMDTFISDLEKEIKETKEKIVTLEGEERYQTTSEMEKTEQTIHQLESQISAAENEISSEQAAQKELQEKMEKLQLRKDDQQKWLNEKDK